MATHPRGERFRVSEGDWVCQNKDCQNLNFARRDKCNKCGLPISTANQVVKMSGSEIGTKFAEKSKGLFSANDWQCGKCGNINWARRSTCNVCNAPKVGPDETRTGYGGGFKENDNVTYKEKEDSDGEFDEFRRKRPYERIQESQRAWQQFKKVRYSADSSTNSIIKTDNLIDTDVNFACSIVPILRSLPPKKNREVKIEIQKLLMAYEFGEETQNTSTPEEQQNIATVDKA